MNPLAPAPSAGELSTSAPSLEDDSVSTRFPPDTATFDPRVVTLFIDQPSRSLHRLRSNVEPLNSSPNTCCQDPATGTPEDPDDDEEDEEPEEEEEEEG